MRILIPLDGSALSESIILHVSRLVRRDVEMVLLRVVAAPMMTMAGTLPEGGRMPESAGRAAAEEMEEGRQSLEAVADRLRRTGFVVETILDTGDPADTILERARSLGADLIAMTTHGRSGVSRMLFGSVAESVLRNSPVPVLALRGR